MDTEGLSVLCSGLVSYETDEYGRPLLNEDDNFIYYKEKYCLGMEMYKFCMYIRFACDDFISDSSTFNCG